MEGVLNTVLDHICMWDALGPLSGTKSSNRGCNQQTSFSWNHTWWWMAIVTQSDGTREITASRMTPEKKQQVIRETLQALGAYQELKDEARKARDRDTPATSDPVHRASRPASGSTGGCRDQRPWHHGEAWCHGWWHDAWHGEASWDSSWHSSWSDARWHC